MTLAAFLSAGSFVVSSVVGFLVYLNTRRERIESGEIKALEAYDKLVSTLQAELARVQAELDAKQKQIDVLRAMLRGNGGGIP